MVGGQGGGGNERDDESRRKASANKQMDMESAERGRVQGQLPCALNHVKIQLDAVRFAQCPYL